MKSEHFNAGKNNGMYGKKAWNSGLKRDPRCMAIGRKNSAKLKGRKMPKPDNYSDIMRKARPPKKRRHDSSGYILLYMPDYKGSYRTKHLNGRIYEHKYVMEKHIGRLMTKGECIHHLNGIKDDNRLENLLLCHNTKEHMAVHQAEQKFVEELIRDGKAEYDRKTGRFYLR